MTERFVAQTVIHGTVHTRAVQDRKLFTHCLPQLFFSIGNRLNGKPSPTDSSKVGSNQVLSALQQYLHWRWMGQVFVIVVVVASAATNHLPGEAADCQETQNQDVRLYWDAYGLGQVNKGPNLRMNGYVMVSLFYATVVSNLLPNLYNVGAVRLIFVPCFHLPKHVHMFACMDQANCGHGLLICLMAYPIHFASCLLHVTSCNQT